MSTTAPQVIQFPGSAALAEEAAKRVAAIAQAAIADHGYFAWAVSGGNTPVAMYRLLTQAPYCQQIDWSHSHIFFADERFVAHDHPDSNCLLTQENLLRHVPIAPENLHAVPITTPEESAVAYAEEIQAFFAPAPPRFDLITLGMGPDGHTASLFPGMDDYSDPLVAAVYNSPKPPPTRITLTYALLNQAHHVIFLVTGKDKAGLVADIADLKPATFPAGKISGTDRPIVWLACTTN